MKGQDILLLVKLLCLESWKTGDTAVSEVSEDLSGWSDEGELNAQLRSIDAMLESAEYYESLFTLRGLATELGISKSEISKSLKRCVSVKRIDNIL